jgi:hypothetical protein
MLCDAGIIVLTMLINATTIEYMISRFGFMTQTDAEKAVYLGTRPLIHNFQIFKSVRVHMRVQGGVHVFLTRLGCVHACLTLICARMLDFDLSVHFCIGLVCGFV